MNRSSVKQLAKRVAASGAVLRLEELLLRGSLAARRVRGSAAGHEVLIATNGRGNLGDQAMLDAFVANTPGDIVVVMSRAGDLHLPDRGAGRVVPVVLGGYFDGSRPLNLRGALRLAALLRGARGLAVVGADIMDGSYGPREAVARLAALGHAARRGLDARLLGFSWGNAPHPRAVQAVGRLPRSVRLLVRDPASLGRLRELGAAGAVDAADTVFALPAPPSDRTGVALDLAGPVVVLNVSGLIASRMEVVAEYERIVRHLVSLDARVLLLPHVVRAGDDDLAACRAVLERVPHEHVRLAEDPLDVATVQATVRGAALVITGRMHLSILAMNCGVPAVVFATQGKVEGMLERLGLPELAVMPGPGMGDRVIDLLPDLGVCRGWAERLAVGLPGVRRLAGLNFTRAA